MRIIDADRAKEIAEVSFGDIFLQTAIKLLLDNTPTADSVEAMHGHWSRIVSDFYMCSNCAEAAHVKEVMGKPDWNYCPNCGAKMDAEGKHND